MSKKKSIKSFVFGENMDLKMDQILGGYSQTNSFVWDNSCYNQGGGGSQSEATVNCNPPKPTDILCSTTTSKNCPGVPTSTGCNTGPNPPTPEPPIERTTMNPTSCWNTEFICYPDPY